MPLVSPLLLPLRGEIVGAIGVLGVSEGICLTSAVSEIFFGAVVIGVNVGGLELFMLIKLLGVGVRGGILLRLKLFDEVVTTFFVIFSG